MKNIILAVREWWNSLFITPKQAAECANALRKLHRDVHAYVDTIPTPEETFADWRARGLIK